MAETPSGVLPRQNIENKSSKIGEATSMAILAKQAEKASKL